MRQLHLYVQGQDNQLYRLIINSSLLNQVPNAGSPLTFQNRKIEITNVLPRKGSDGNLEIIVNSKEQLKIL